MDLGRYLRVSVVALALSGLSVSPVILHAATMQAAAKSNIDDTWQGTLHVEKDLRTIVKVSKGPDGTLTSLWYSIDRTPRPIPITATAFQAGELRLNVEAIDGVYTGKMSADGNTIVGEWKQAGKSMPLTLVRSTAETAWAIPEPPKPVPAMAADADPNWEVATIKLAPPDEQGKGFGGPPRHFRTGNTTLNDLVMFAYQVNTKQIVGGPAWMETDKFDITTGEPDVPGSPSDEQTRSMMRKLLEQRFGLKFHKDKKEMSAYVLTVAKGGPKLTASKSDPHDGTAFYFTKLGNLIFRNISMDGFATWMENGVFDRPVVNRTAIEGRWDGTLKWTPDETQFQIFGVKIVPDESPDAPPPVFTAIQQQMGLKLDAEKTAVEVMVLDHLEKPTEN